MSGKCEIVYMDGTREKIDLKLVCQYSLNDSSDFVFSGTGCGIGYILQFIQERKPIVISKDSGISDIERIINSANIKRIENLEPSKVDY